MTNNVYPITGTELSDAEAALMAAEAGCASATSRVHAVLGAIAQARRKKSALQKAVEAILRNVPASAVEVVGGRKVLRCGDSQGSMTVEVEWLAAKVLESLTDGDTL